MRLSGADMKILITDGLEPEAISTLRKTHEVDVQEVDPKGLLDVVAGYHALIVRSRTIVSKAVLIHAPKLKVVGRAGVGVDNIDVAEATARKIAVVNAPTASTISVAELAIGHMISLFRHLPEADRSVKEGRWEKKKLEGRELFEKTLGLVGRSCRKRRSPMRCGPGSYREPRSMCSTPSRRSGVRSSPHPMWCSRRTSVPRPARPRRGRDRSSRSKCSRSSPVAGPNSL